MLQREPGDGGPLAYKAQRWPGAHAELLFVALEAGRFERAERRADRGGSCAESKASRGVFGAECFSFGRLSELVGHEIQHGGQKSEAGGSK
jgi:hypothetical protein